MLKFLLHLEVRIGDDFLEFLDARIATRVQVHIVYHFLEVLHVITRHRLTRVRLQCVLRLQHDKFTVIIHPNMERAYLHRLGSGLLHLSPFKIPWHFPDKIGFPWHFILFFNLWKKQFLTVINGNFPHTPQIFERQKFNSNNQCTLSLYLPSRHSHKYNPGGALIMW